MTTRSKLGSWALSAALALGCSHTMRGPSAMDQPRSNRAKPSATANAEKENQKLTPASGGLTVPERLVRQHCMREQQCGNIGPEKTYSSGSACLSQVQQEWQAALEARECNYGVNEVRLRRCLSFMRVQDCKDWYDQQTLDNQCRADQICLEEP